MEEIKKTDEFNIGDTITITQTYYDKNRDIYTKEGTKGTIIEIDEKRALVEFDKDHKIRGWIKTSDIKKV